MSKNILDMSVQELCVHLGITPEENEIRDLCSQADIWGNEWTLICSDCLGREYGDTARRLAEIAHELGWRVIDDEPLCRECVKSAGENPG